MNNDPALRLPDGRVFRLPSTVDQTEFRLPGNCRVYADGCLIGLYDETSATGSVLHVAVGIWTSVHPVSREAFWVHCEVLESGAAQPCAKALPVQ